MTDNLPVNWQEEMAKQAVAVARSERPSLSGISFKGGGLMYYMDQLVPGNAMDVIVVASVFENVYYDKPFDADVPATPACYAFSAKGEGMAPDYQNIKEPQHASCDGCPQNQWGSAMKNGKPGKGKACKNIRKLAVIPAGAQDIAQAEVALMRIPVTSINNWKTYVQQVAGMYKRPPYGVITKISNNPHTKNQFEVKFQCIGLVEDERMPAVWTRVPLAQESLMQPYTQSAEEAEEVKTPAKPRKFSK